MSGTRYLDTHTFVNGGGSMRAQADLHRQGVLIFWRGLSGYFDSDKTADYRATRDRPTNQEFRRHGPAGGFGYSGVNNANDT